MIYGNAIITRKEPQTYIFEDKSGNQITGVYVEKETVFTATDNDVREGMVYAGDIGISTGTKDIPAYHTTEGVTVVPVGRAFDIYIATAERYDFTKMQAIICPFNGTPDKSVAAEKVVINSSVYAVGSTDEIAVVTVDHDSKKIKLGITNDGTTPFVIRYFTCKEEY